MTNRLRIVSACMGSILLYIAGCGGTREGREVHIAAAANLQVVVKEIDRAFEAKTDIRVVPTLGATAQLTQQIENGAPIDVFLAADTQHVDQLIARQLADRQTRAIYARGQLVLWAPSQPELTRLADLASPRIRRVGCARPELAPYGSAAIQALKKEGLWESVEPKLVYGQNISVAKQFADSGNTEASFTALSLVRKTSGHYIVIDQSEYDALDQALCNMKRSEHPELARRFREFVLSEDGRAILSEYGYSRGDH